jgi:hypothetical protein
VVVVVLILPVPPLFVHILLMLLSSAPVARVAYLLVFCDLRTASKQ